MITHDDIVYMAGLFDGEGSYFIQKLTNRKGTSKRTGEITYYKDYYFPVASLGLINKEVILWILEKFRGNYYEHKREKENYNTLHQWRLYKFEDIKRFMNLIEPYTKIKKINSPSNKENIPVDEMNRILELLNA